MRIQWYPGHMAKSMRLIEESLPLVDVLIYVLDARAPMSCINPQFEKPIGTRPVIYVLNKADLADKAATEKFIKRLSGEKSVALAVNATASKSAAGIVAAAKRLCGEKLEKYRLKGVRTSVKAMVIGVPNSGKSTIVNNLCGAAKTVTGNRAGVTRGKQWVRVNDFFEVLDTPGTLYPKLDNARVAERLAVIGSIKDEVINTHELALVLLDMLASACPSALETRYKSSITGEAGLIAIGRSRGFVVRGGEIDIERAATALIDDFRKGRLGAITLDDPDAKEWEKTT